MGVGSQGRVNPSHDRSAIVRAQKVRTRPPPAGRCASDREFRNGNRILSVNPCETKILILSLAEAVDQVPISIAWVYKSNKLQVDGADDVSKWDFSRRSGSMAREGEERRFPCRGQLDSGTAESRTCMHVCGSDVRASGRCEASRVCVLCVCVCAPVCVPSVCVSGSDIRGPRGPRLDLARRDGFLPFSFSRSCCCRLPQAPASFRLDASKAERRQGSLSRESV